MTQPVAEDAGDTEAECSKPEEEDAPVAEVAGDTEAGCSKPEIEDAAFACGNSDEAACPRNTNNPEDVEGDASEAIGEHEPIQRSGEVSVEPGAAAAAVPFIPPDAEGGRVSIGCAALGAKAGPGAPIRRPPRARNRFAPSMVACFSASA